MKLVGHEEEPAGLDIQSHAGQRISDVIGKEMDDKNEDDITTEEKLDQKLRENRTWNLEVWRKERTGLNQGEKDSLRQKLE